MMQVVPSLDFLEPHPSDDSPISFEQLANALLAQGEFCSPAELHGGLCGLLGGGIANDPSLLIANLEQTLGLELRGEASELLGALGSAIVSAVGSGDYDFYPLLPDDSVDLDQRVEALAGWCRGFLSGYAQGRIGQQTQAEAVAPDSAEVLKDFAAIAQADSDADDQEGESDFFELLEYVRVAAMNVLADTGIDEAETTQDDEQSG
ncbi:MAG: UPF0149 family protein [Pseudomonadota bacterium]